MRQIDEFLDKETGCCHHSCEGLRVGHAVSQRSPAPEFAESYARYHLLDSATPMSQNAAITGEGAERLHGNVRQSRELANKTTGGG
ncbi:hypothetical protein L083_4522 [Actinoplanes sp. N902-109]|nr:hypothetical protein L083_4522 [Actinoplanes sp. N902-109]